MSEPTDQNLWGKVINFRSIQTQLSDDSKSSSTFDIENCGDCILSDVSSCSELELDLKESRCASALITDPAVQNYRVPPPTVMDDGKSSSTTDVENCGDSDVSSCSELDLKESIIPALRTDPAVDLGDAFDLFESEDEEESSSSSGGSPGSVAACALSHSSTNFCKDGRKSSSSTITIEKGNCGDCYLSDVSSCSELELDLKENRCVSALKTDPAVQNSGLPVSPTVMVYDLPPRPARPVLQCWKDPQVASDRKTDRFPITPADHTSLDDCVTMSAPGLYRTESDLTVVSLDEDDVYLPAPSAGVEPVAPVLLSSSGGASVPVSGGGLSEAWVELERVLVSNMASLQQEVTVRLDGVENTLTAELQLRKRLREEERWAERHRQGRRLEGLPMWLRRLGDALKGLVKTRPKSGKVQPADSAAAAASAAATGSDVSGHKELCHVAQSACHSQVALERTRSKYAHAKERQATTRDEKILSQALEQLDDLERVFQKQQEQMLQDVENTLNWLLGTENSGGPVDLEEAKRSEEGMKNNKPKKKGLKRFFKCLCCLK
ncbi:uncharacterized protein LOC134102550 [Sardina pilchardus]|uniref:uncharacterized protein LOC134102550 n=1 Tax=Sardina pilchardus TaxID=27697 RepID=UPI002E11FD33